MCLSVSEDARTGPPASKVLRNRGQPRHGPGPAGTPGRQLKAPVKFGVNVKSTEGGPRERGVQSGHYRRAAQLGQIVESQYARRPLTRARLATRPGRAGPAVPGNCKISARLTCPNIITKIRAIMASCCQCCGRSLRSLSQHRRNIWQGRAAAVPGVRKVPGHFRLYYNV